VRVIDEVGGYEYDIAPLTEEEQAEAVTNRERYIKRADAADPERSRRLRKVKNDDGKARERRVPRARREDDSHEEASNSSDAAQGNGAGNRALPDWNETSEAREPAMSTKTAKSKEGKTTHRCTTCGKRFEGTGKRGRPYQRCPTHRG